MPCDGLILQQRAESILLEISTRQNQEKADSMSVSYLEAAKIKEAKPNNGQTKSGTKKATNSQSSDSEEKRSERKYDDSDGDLDKKSLTVQI